MITMKILTQLAIVFGICLVGECISAILPFTFPSSVIGMIILFLLMLVKIIKERHIKDVSQFMLKNMAFFFIPVAVSIMDNITYLQGHIMVFDLYCCNAAYLYCNIVCRNWRYEVTRENYSKKRSETS